MTTEPKRRKLATLYVGINEVQLYCNSPASEDLHCRKFPYEQGNQEDRDAKIALATADINDAGFELHEVVDCYSTTYTVKKVVVNNVARAIRNAEIKFTQLVVFLRIIR